MLRFFSTLYMIETGFSCTLQFSWTKLFINGYCSSQLKEFSLSFADSFRLHQRNDITINGFRGGNLKSKLYLNFFMLGSLGIMER